MPSRLKPSPKSQWHARAGACEEDEASALNANVSPAFASAAAKPISKGGGRAGTDLSISLSMRTECGFCTKLILSEVLLQQPCSPNTSTISYSAGFFNPKLTRSMARVRCASVQL